MREVDSGLITMVEEEEGGEGAPTVLELKEIGEPQFQMTSDTSVTLTTPTPEGQ